MKKKSIIIIIVLGWLAGLACCYWLTGQKKVKRIITENHAATKQRIIHAENSYRKKTELLQRQNERLNESLRNTSKELQNVKQKTTALQQQLKQRISNQQSLTKDKDTVRLLSNCDSLISGTAAYIAAVNSQDSIHEAVAANLAMQLQIKDTVIAAQDERFTIMKEELDKNLLQQQLLEEQILAEQKANRKQRRKSKMKSIGIALLSGLLLWQTLR